MLTVILIYIEGTFDTGSSKLSTDKFQQGVKGAKELVDLINKLTTHDATVPPNPDAELVTPSSAQWAGISKAGVNVLRAYCHLAQASETSAGELFAMPLVAKLAKHPSWPVCMQ